VVGCGVLGTIICHRLLSHPTFASRIIVGVTKTKTRHELIRQSVLQNVDADGVIGGENTDNNDNIEKRFQLVTLDEVLATATTTSSSQPRRLYKDVVFCAPPSGFDNYASSIMEVATSLWSGIIDQQGSFVFTSSGVVYDDGVRVEDGATATAAITIVNESSPTVIAMDQSKTTTTTTTTSSNAGTRSSNSAIISSSTNASKDGLKNPRALRMLHAENATLSIGGCALRLAGLYSLDRGAHNYWLEKFGGSATSTNNDDDSKTTPRMTVPSRGDGIINLLHYEDAASAVISALVAGPTVNSKRIFLISDGKPMTRKQICTSARQHLRYGAFGMPLFIDDATDVGTTDQMGGGLGKGKVYDGRKSNDALHWKPKYPSFDEFMTSSSS
jgi:nucleoside-diphosphate-sugar epimerase